MTNAIRAREARGESAGAAVDRSPDEVSRFLEDAAHFPGGHADGVARPRSEREIAELVKGAARVLPIGAQSSLTGGATPAGGLVLSTERLTGITPAFVSVRAGAGVPLVTLQESLVPSGRWYAPVPTFTGAFVGGVVATNAAGAATFKYGTTRQWVDGLTVVLACGCVLDITRGATVAGGDRRFVVGCAHGTREFRHGAYQMPAVPKCSAGYFAAPGMDLIDLFIGAEGTLGVVSDATLRVSAMPPASATALVFIRSERRALDLTDQLRRASMQTWATKNVRGIDVSAIEYIDRRSLELIKADGEDRKQQVTIPTDADVLLVVHLEFQEIVTRERAYDQIAAALTPAAPDAALMRFCRLLDRHGAFDTAEIAFGDEQRRRDQFLALREAAPATANRRVGEAKRNVDTRIEKTAADMIVPFEHFGEMLHIYQAGLSRRGLDFAIWGHISDGNVHPNVIPKSYDDVVKGRDAILEFGREAARLGGAPLAEHGVGRSSIKQALLASLYGQAGIDEMRAIKRALDPDAKLAPGVLFPT